MKSNVKANFHHGKLYEAYKYFGAHIKKEPVRGVEFTVWAPNASSVSLVGTFNYWNDKSDQMTRISDTGIWRCFFRNIGEGEVYKYKIFTKDGRCIYKADPYAFYSELRPGTSSVVADINKFAWNDDKWLEKRKKANLYKLPVNIYEIHAGSWMRHQDKDFSNDESYLSYKELADKLIPYLKDMSYTHVEIMPLMEHPYDGSWGYQTTGYYSVTSRYGRPEDLMYLIDKCHQHNIGVILDWVPGHFCRDEHGLMNFDGSELYGHIDHPNWGTKKFNFKKSEVKNFLISNALFYFEKYHIDGIRVDGVTSILQLNFGMNDTPYRNKYNGLNDLDGIEFIKELNSEVFKRYPFAIMAAEESTAWPLVTYPVDKGGLGFNFKWNMGWMNDTISYIKNDPIYRKEHHEKITFSMHFAFSENFILPFSHDEVVHSKKTLIDKSYGSYEEKFKNLKLLALYQMTHPGKKLNFMSNEFGQFMEWRYYEDVEWFLLKYPIHDSHRAFIKKLNYLYKNEEAFWERDGGWEGFQWIDADNKDQSIFSYIRWSSNDFVIVVLNFTPVAYDVFEIGVPKEGEYKIILNSDADIYNGTGTKYKEYIKSQKKELHSFKYSLKLELPGLTGLLIKKKKKRS